MIDLPAVRLVGHAALVPLVHEGFNPHIAEHVAAIGAEETLGRKTLNDTEPSGVLAVATTGRHSGGVGRHRDL